MQPQMAKPPLGIEGHCRNETGGCPGVRDVWHVTPELKDRRPRVPVSDCWSCSEPAVREALTVDDAALFHRELGEANLSERRII